MVKTDDRKKYAVPAVSALLDILEYMSEKDSCCGVTELSKELGISANLAFRIMKCLADRKYADSNAGQYRLSTGFFTLGMKLYSRFELRRRARSHLEVLSDNVHSTCQIQVPQGNHMLVMDVVTPDAPFYIQVVPGSRLNYHCNAFGKAVLAFYSEEKIKDLLPARLPALTPHSITARSLLIKELVKVKKEGVAFDKEEYNLGFLCIGAPVLDVNGNAIAGIGLTGLSNLFPPECHAKAIEQVRACAESVSRDIGYYGDYFKRNS